MQPSHNQRLHHHRYLALVSCVAMTLLLPSSAYAQTEAEAEAESKAESEEPAADDTYYLKFTPNFVVNLRGPSESRFLMVTLEGMARQLEGVQATERHMPGIRHHVLMLLSEQSPDRIKSVEDKQRLMHEALARIQEFLVSETGKPCIDAVYFTDFVVE